MPCPLSSRQEKFSAGPGSSQPLCRSVLVQLSTPLRGCACGLCRMSRGSTGGTPCPSGAAPPKRLATAVVLPLQRSMLRLQQEGTSQLVVQLPQLLMRLHA